MSSLQHDRSTPSRRGNDAARRSVSSSLGRWSRQRRDPVALGRALLLASGLVVSATAPLLARDRRTWLVLMGLTAVMGGFLLASRWLPWSRLPARTTLA